MPEVLICGDQSLGRWLAKEHLGAFSVRQVPGLRVVEARPLVACIVIAADVIGSRELETAARAARVFPIARIILVSRFHRDAVAALSNAPELFERTVWLEDVDIELERRVHKAIGTHFLERGAETVAALLGTMPTARRFIELAWIVPRPPTTVRRTIAELRVPSSTFFDHWRDAQLEDRPKAFLDWGVLGRAVTDHKVDEHWFRTAHRGGVHLRTLKRMARRCVGEPLPTIEHRGTRWFEHRFQRWLAKALP